MRYFHNIRLRSGQSNYHYANAKIGGQIWLMVWMQPYFQFKEINLNVHHILHLSDALFFHNK